MILDCFSIIFAFWAAFALRLSTLWPAEQLENTAFLLPLLCAAGVGTFWVLGLYRTMLRTLGRLAMYSAARGIFVLALVLTVAAFMVPESRLPRSVPIIFCMTLFVTMIGVRLLAQSYFFWMMNRLHTSEPVLIYGAGGAGIQLNSALDPDPKYQVVGFIDDDRFLRRHEIAGRRVHGPSEIPALMKSYGVNKVLIAIPSLPVSRRREIVLSLSALGLAVQTVPTASEIVSGQASIDTLRQVSIDDLLGRDSVDPHLELLSGAVVGKSVMVTGAGGSIGSELCRQIAALGPKRLVLYEQSELALYTVEMDLQEIFAGSSQQKLEIVPVLGSVCDSARLAMVLQREKVDAVYHAAAYKHVPIVEQNVLEGLRNNVVGSAIVAREAAAAGVERAVLVSTDKAVRPTSVMGASKRWAEIVFQVAQTRSSGTTFSSVRFGNVLGSSGSVIPRFERQIRAGGPVTVTHPEMIRYFMTIPEAAQLVVQASSMAQGGDVFVLDMGEPVRIVELARHMVALHGLTVKDDDNPEGDIEIVYSGMRPGEKLYEELLIGNDPVTTEHPKIMRARETHPEPVTLDQAMDQLSRAIQEGCTTSALSVLRAIVDEFSPTTTPQETDVAAEKKTSAPLPRSAPIPATGR